MVTFVATKFSRTISRLKTEVISDVSESVFVSIIGAWCAVPQFIFMPIERALALIIRGDFTARNRRESLSACSESVCLSEKRSVCDYS
jgi:hypothetical protein